MPKDSFGSGNWPLCTRARGLGLLRGLGQHLFGFQLCFFFALLSKADRDGIASENAGSLGKNLNASRQILSLTISCKCTLFLKIKKKVLFLAVLGLRCCAQSFSSAASGGYLSLWCAGFSLRWLLFLRSTGSRHAGFSSCDSRAQAQYCGARA